MDERPNPPLADDPNFLASLDALDRGLKDQRVDREIEAPPPPPQAPPVLPPPQATIGRRRPLLDLFPLEPSLTRSTSPSASPQNAAAPVRFQQSPQTTTGRRALLDLFPPAPSSAPAEAPAPDEALTYERFYGLDEKPFTLSSDPKFFYHSTAHDRVVQELLSAIRQRDALVIVTGETGTGKTMLCRAVIEALDRRTLTCLVVDSVTSIEELLKTILTDFGVISRDDVSHGRLARASLDGLTSALREFLSSLAPLQAFAVVLIDEAQNVPVDVLQRLPMLLNVEGEQPLLQIVLVGQPRLLRVLARSELRGLAGRASVRCELATLAADEASGYVLHRIAAAGGSARVKFDDTALARLYELSAGVPRIINTLCDRALTLGGESTASVIDEALVAKAADDLDVEPPRSQASEIAKRALAGVFVITLMLAGAAGAAIVFHDRLVQLIGRWEAIPPAPRMLTPPQPPGLQPLPPPSDAAGNPPPPQG